MFRINIIAPGKNKEDWIEEAVNHYLKLLKKFANVSFVYIPDIKKSKNITSAELMRCEAERIERQLKSPCRLALSDNGRKFDSLQFAVYLSELMEKCGGSVDFIIGGIYGIDKSLLESCRAVISLSPMTISHQLIRPVLLEQLYRGFSILSGNDYHK